MTTYSQGKKEGQEDGQAALVSVLFFLSISLTITFGFSFMAVREARLAKINFDAKRSYYLAEAGVEDMTVRVKKGLSPDPLEIISLDGFSVTTTFSDSGSDRIVRAVANIENAVRNVEVTLGTNKTDASFNYGLQVGYLGLRLENNGTINGSVYSNGSVTGAQNTLITGDLWVAAGTASTSDQEQLTVTTDLQVSDISARRDGAQSFMPSITADVRKVSFYIKKVGNPGDINLFVVADNNGDPSDQGTAYARGEIRASQVTTTYSWVDIALNSQNPVFQNQKYWVILSKSANATRYYVVGGNADNSYSAGTFKYSEDWNANPPVWTSTGNDAAFKVFLGTEDTSVDGGSIGRGVTGDVHAHTIKNAIIAGSAYYQTLENTTVGGVFYATSPPPPPPPNLFPGSPDPPPQNMPLSQGQLEQFRQDGTAGGVCGIVDGCDADGGYELDGSASGTLGPRRINGNLRVENLAQLTMTGTLYVRGNVTLKSSSTIRLDPLYGATSGVIIADGTIRIENHNLLLGSGDPASYLVLISTNPGLSAPPAISIENNATTAVFYASEGAVVIQNQSSVKEAVGQQLVIRNNASVSYETGLRNVQFSAGPSGGYTIQQWKEVE